MRSSVFGTRESTELSEIATLPWHLNHNRPPGTSSGLAAEGGMLVAGLAHGTMQLSGCSVTSLSHEEASPNSQVQQSHLQCIGEQRTEDNGRGRYRRGAW